MVAPNSVHFDEKSSARHGIGAARESWQIPAQNFLMSRVYFLGVAIKIVISKSAIKIHYLLSDLKKMLQASFQEKSHHIKSTEALHDDDAEIY